MSAPQPDSEPTGPVRLSLNVSAEVADILRGYAESKGMSATSAAVRAIRLLGYVDEVQQRGGKILVEEDGKSVELIFM